MVTYPSTCITWEKGGTAAAAGPGARGRAPGPDRRRPAPRRPASGFGQAQGKELGMSTTTTIRPDPTQRGRKQDAGLAGALATVQQQYGPAVVGSPNGA